MAKLYGYYSGNPGTPGDPTGIGVTATPAESDRLADMTPTRPPVTAADGTDRLYHTFPPSRETVKQIVKRVEVDCTDQHLIDWMGKGV